MAAKIAKIQLEMKDGIRVRTLAELKANFDVEKLVGHYIDGKLKKWLETRWYEEEAEQLGKLDSEDPEFVERLCAIFGIEYKKEILDPKLIAMKNSRIAKLKQYTDDEDVLKNIESVAFNQEELEELWTTGSEKIYLCDGPFLISSSNRNLNYIVIGNALVKREEENINGIVCEEEIESIELPKDLADMIGDGVYAESESFVVWKLRTASHSDYKWIERRFFEIGNIVQKSIGIYDKRQDLYYTENLPGNIGEIEKLDFIENKLVAVSREAFKGYMLRIYEITSSGIDCVYEKQVWCDYYSIFESQIAFRIYQNNPEKRVIYIWDSAARKEFDTKINPDIHPYYFTKYILHKDSLLYVKGNTNTLYRYNLTTSLCSEVFPQEKLQVKNMLYYKDELIVHYYNEQKKNGEIVGITDKNRYKYIDSDSDRYSSYYVPNLNMLILKTFRKLYFLDLESKTYKSIAIDYVKCGDIKIVGNYLYYKRSYEQMMEYRIDLTSSLKTPEKVTYFFGDYKK